MNRIINCTVIDCGIGVSLPKDGNVSVEGLSAIRTGLAVEVRDEPSLLEQIGLPKNTPVDMVIEALNGLSNLKATKEEKLNSLEGSKLANWLLTSLGTTANITAILSGIVQLQEQGKLGYILAHLIPK